jgi:hypothetical protein
MALGFRGSLRTSSAPQHPPFKVEVANNRDILCHVGRIFEPLSSSIYGQNLQKSWDATQSKYTSKGLPNTRSGKIELKYHNYDVKTGSAKIHYKGSNGTASQGRATASSANQTVSDNGYVKWARSAGPLHNYIVLHREVDSESPDTGKWCISAVAESAVLDSDIVIAYINNGKMVRQVWKSDVTFSGGSGGGGVVDNTQPHPFQIVKDEVSMRIYVREGTVNSVPASTGWMGAGTQWFWLRTYPSPMIGTSDGGKSESQCWVSIGRVVADTENGTIEVFQHLKSSLWAERFKCGSQPAKYWHSAV